MTRLSGGNNHTNSCEVLELGAGSATRACRPTIVVIAEVWWSGSLQVFTIVPLCSRLSHVARWLQARSDDIGVPAFRDCVNRRSCSLKYD